MARQVGEPVPLWEGLHLTFTVALQRGDGKRLREALREMESLIGRVGDVGRRWSTQYCAATVAQIDGDLVRCEQIATQAYAGFAPVSADRAASAYYGQLLPLRLEQDRLAELQPIVLALVAGQPGVTAWHAAAALVLAASARGGVPGGAEARVTADDPVADDEVLARARSHAQSALDLAQDDFIWLAAHVMGGRAAALLGDADLIDRYARRLRPWADLVCWQGTCSYGPVAAVSALLAEAAGDRRAARDFAERAASLTGSLAHGSVRATTS